MEIEQLIDTYSDTLYRVAFVYTRDRTAAEEVVQDVFYKFYKSNQFEARAHVKTYLIKMTINRSTDYLRSWKNKKALLIEKITRSDRPAEAEALVNEERGLILGVILTLHIKYREAILLHYYEDFSINEISDMLHVPVSTVKSRLQRARHQLRPKLENEHWEVLRHGE